MRDVTAAIGGDRQVTVTSTNRERSYTEAQFGQALLSAVFTPPCPGRGRRHVTNDLGLPYSADQHVNVPSSPCGSVHQPMLVDPEPIIHKEATNRAFQLFDLE